MNFYSFSDQLMFKALKNIEHGVIYLTNFDDKKYILGSEDQKLKANIKINKPGFSFNIINKGSIGLAESYMRGDFETNLRAVKMMDEFSKFLHFGRASTVSILIFVSVVPIIVLNVFRNKEENSL